VLRQAQHEGATLMIFLTVRLMIFLILSLTKDAENHPAPTFAAVIK
jgi:hypothetical protein